MEGWVDL